MTKTYLFATSGLTALAEFISKDTLYAFDLDGTLAPIVEEYSAAQVPEAIKHALTKLSQLANVAIITGRSRKVALTILGFEPPLLIGNHGAEWPGQENDRSREFKECCLKWQEQLRQNLSEVPGLEFELKGISLTVHYRKTIDKEMAIEKINTAIEKLSPGPRRIAGKNVVNLLPMDAITKGQALMAAMNTLRSKRAIFLGDDVTDEEVFKLKNPAIFGIHIGTENETAARYYLKQQTEMTKLLAAITGTLESGKQDARSSN